MAIRNSKRHLVELEKYWESTDSEEVFYDAYLYILTVSLEFSVGKLTNEEAQELFKRIDAVYKKKYEQVADRIGQEKIGIANASEKAADSSEGFAALKNGNSTGFAMFAKEMARQQSRLDTLEKNTKSVRDFILNERHTVSTKEEVGLTNGWRLAYALANIVSNRNEEKRHDNLTINELLDSDLVLENFKKNFLSLRRGREYAVAFNAAIRGFAQSMQINLSGVYYRSRVQSDGILERLEYESKRLLDILNSSNLDVNEDVIHFLTVVSKERRKSITIPAELQSKIDETDFSPYDFALTNSDILILSGDINSFFREKDMAEVGLYE